MEARTFTPRPKKQKAHQKLKNIPTSGPSSAPTTIGQQDEENHGWSLVSRGLRQQPPRRHHNDLSMSSLGHVLPNLPTPETSTNSPQDTLSHLRATLADTNRRGLFREELLQRLCRVTPSKQAGGLLDPLAPPLPAQLTRDDAQAVSITGTALLLDAYAAVASPSSVSTPWPRAPEDTLTQLRARHAKITESWRASDARPALHAHLRLLVSRADSTSTTSSHAPARTHCICLCLGLGSLSAEATGWKAVSMWQLVIWEDICQSLFGADGTRLVFQDPLFNAHDVLFLTQELGYEVVHSPAGYDLLDPLVSSSGEQKGQKQEREVKSVVFAPHFPLRFWPQGVRLGKPLFVIGNGVGSAGEEELLLKIPGRKVVGRAVALIEGLSRSTSSDDAELGQVGTLEDDTAEKAMSFEYEADVMRRETWAREEMELFLRRWTSVQCPTPDECREALWETVVWSPRDDEDG